MPDKKNLVMVLKYEQLAYQSLGTKPKQNP